MCVPRIASIEQVLVPRELLERLGGNARTHPNVPPPFAPNTRRRVSELIGYCGAGHVSIGGPFAKIVLMR